MMQQTMSPFILTQKQEQLFTRVTEIMYLNQSMLQLYQTYKNILKKVWVNIQIHSTDHNPRN